MDNESNPSQYELEEVFFSSVSTSEVMFREEILSSVIANNPAIPVKAQSNQKSKSALRWHIVVAGY